LTGKGSARFEGTTQLCRHTNLWPFEMTQGISHPSATPEEQRSPLSIRPTTRGCLE